MYRPDALHGVETSSGPADRTHDTGLLIKAAELPIFRNGTRRIHLLQEALARARMRDLWREEHRHKREAGGFIRDARRFRRR